ncbi:AAA family ATPase [Brevundimonas sp.]|uniref:phage NrS-1 polymerase family protein n=1 Tax=Brevundimonas sp. TaxID=1871086 RepID=UPI0028A041CF|nr:AAA family ATPase [Brevundimonas sp.]
MTTQIMGQPPEGPQPAALSARMAQWRRIPAELRERPQWAIAVGDKRPQTPSGRPASVSDPSTWTDFSTACEAASRAGGEIGFMLSENDPLVVIDMDVKDDTPPDHIDGYERLAEASGGYVERSRSGRGLHAWVEGHLEGGGCRRDGVEVYDRARFMICTGDVQTDRPIQDAQPLLDVLVEKMRGRKSVSEPLDDGPEAETDEVILERARSAANGARFTAHFDGNFNAIGHVDHSRADMALMSMLAFYTRNNDQLRRLFLVSALGQRDKATKRQDYIDRTIRAVRASQATGPTIEHGREVALALMGAAFLRLAGANPPAMVTTDDTGHALLKRHSIDWEQGDDVEVPDLIGGLMADEDVTLLGGHGGVGKSFLGMQMAAAVAAGDDVLNRPTRQCRVLYYSAEDGRKRLTRRLRNLVAQSGYDASVLRENLRVVDASELEPLYGEVVGEAGSRFAKILGPRTDFANLQKMVEAFDPQLVVIDGASDTFDGNEIARREVRAFIKLLRRIHPQRKVGVLMLAHIDRSSARGNTTNDDGYTGSSQWHNSCRRRLFLQHVVKYEYEDGEKVPVSESFVLRVMKNQDGPPDPDMELVRGPCGLWHLGKHALGDLSPQDDSAHVETLLTLIGAYYERGSYMSTSFAPQATTGVYLTLKDDPQFPRGLSRKRTEKLVRQLERDGRLVKEEYRRSNRSASERWAVA